MSRAADGTLRCILRRELRHTINLFYKGIVAKLEPFQQARRNSLAKVVVTPARVTLRVIPQVSSVLILWLCALLPTLVFPAIAQLFPAIAQCRNTDVRGS